jgi:flagellar M-ring protein FliF
MQQQANVSKGVPMYAWAMLAALVLGGGLFFIMMRRKKKETSLATAEEEALATAEPIEEIDFTYKDEKKKQIEKLIKEKPDIVVQIIRTWLNEE